MFNFWVLGFSALALAAPEYSVYRRNEAPPTNGTLYPGNCEWGLEGCFNEPSGGRIPKYLTSDKSLTVEKCFAICGAYNYALVEYRSECWCGDEVDPATTPFTGEGTGCRLACAGDQNQLCGGQSKGLLYKRKPAGNCSSTSSSATSTDTSTCVATTVTVTTVDNPVTVPTTLTITNTVISDTTVFNTISITTDVPTTVIETAAPSTVTETARVEDPVTITKTAAPSTVTQTTQVNNPLRSQRPLHR
ncbi:WSC-domain-containing protein [Choiromyces venosus 120613-1]|uniref:WSC-domain-containing protein n=1 Tax=Choiromyces venosus 120613-1 TaxID=1336337 RepID=A0A3N4JB98_9PEZI|nr:WSC-domain-containing protein [Choiromyces venosus 120613-1]